MVNQCINVNLHAIFHINEHLNTLLILTKANNTLPHFIRHHQTSLMDIEEKAKAVDIEVSDAINVAKNIISDGNYQMVGESFKLTTMTVLVMLDYTIDLQMLEKYAIRLPSAWKLKSSNGFYNCVLFKKYTDTTRKHSSAVKVFSNGNLHMTGVKSIASALQLAIEISMFLCNMVETNGVKITYSLENFMIQMMNCCFKINLPEEKSICLRTLHSLLMTNFDFLCIYNNDHHAGLRIKYVSEPDDPNIVTVSSCSIIIFHNGNVLVNAFMTGQDMINAVKFVVDTLNKYSDCTLVDKVENKKRRTPESFDYSKYIVLK